mmetsp:Transcript_5511/g.17398  ORF Transcript_5511/g.17398 Transcript_5511/m.17398 type:complete len:269 (-) Transcript_5511:299-1105(-)
MAVCGLFCGGADLIFNRRVLGDVPRRLGRPRASPRGEASQRAPLARRPRAAARPSKEPDELRPGVYGGRLVVAPSLAGAAHRRIGRRGDVRSGYRGHRHGEPARQLLRRVGRPGAVDGAARGGVRVAAVQRVLRRLERAVAAAVAAAPAEPEPERPRGLPLGEARARGRGDRGAHRSARHVPRARAPAVRAQRHGRRRARDCGPGSVGPRRRFGGRGQFRHRQLLAAARGALLQQTGQGAAGDVGLHARRQSRRQKRAVGRDPVARGV